MSPDFAVILIAATPVGELRAAIPVAREVYNFPLWRAILDAYVGNAIPAFVLILGQRLLQLIVFRHLPHLFFSFVRHRWEKKYERFGAIALCIFTAIPLPLTGVWSASIAAILFRLRPAVALAAILSGMVIAGLIVLFLTEGAAFYANRF